MKNVSNTLEMEGFFSRVKEDIDAYDRTSRDSAVDCTPSPASSASPASPPTPDYSPGDYGYPSPGDGPDDYSMDP